jgi:antitoxin component YwqK of YwqJK toxin-antitoxin module
MKLQKRITAVFASILMLALCFTTSNSFAQTKTKDSMMKDCCMMKDGKMMVMKDGKTMNMEMDMTMKNGTKCMTTGECIMNGGKKIMMKEGDCMEMSGKMGKCSMMNKSMKTLTTKKSKKMAIVYSCPMHPEVTSNEPGKCSKCGMDLVKKS